MATEAKKKVPRRERKARTKVEFNADSPADVHRRDTALRDFNAIFTNDLPQHPGTDQHARNGHYTQVEGDRFEGKTYPIPDGRYRVAGSDWIYSFEAGEFAEAEKATPPDFGGDDVISVEINPANNS